MTSQLVSLRSLFQEAQFINCADIPVDRVVCDSRLVRPGDVYVAVEGTQTDGHAFLEDAITAGASAVIVQRRSAAPFAVPCAVVPSTATAYAVLSMFRDVGSIPPTIIGGVTGTNGKTTTTWILHSILQTTGFRAGLIGTVTNSDGQISERAVMTTPPADVLSRLFRRMADIGTTHCAMEISSHALKQRRCAGLRLSAAAITNVTQDHFDYHRSVDEYRLVKSAIADLLHIDAPLLLNLDDEGCRRILQQLPKTIPVVTYGVRQPNAELSAQVISSTHRSQRLLLQLAQGSISVRLRLIGRHNAENCLAAAGLAEQMGVPLRDIADGIEAVTAVPGRLERIDEGQDFLVLVDYAHTPDALARCIHTVSEFAPGRVICVFGAGGERDREKRPLMAQAAAAADLVIVTSDNPRTESPTAIIRDIVSGFPASANVLQEPDRQAAIIQAIAAAEPGDVVLIAGKGHEDQLEVGTDRIPFDDRNVARRILGRRQSHWPHSIPHTHAHANLLRTASVSVAHVNCTPAGSTEQRAHLTMSEPCSTNASAQSSSGDSATRAG